MAMVINTNIGSNNAVRLLDITSRNQQITMDRLTSGLRINSSKDDAAGMSVVTNMTKQIRGIDMAVRNANDGMNMMQTMDATMEQVTDMMQRMRELGLQSQNGTYTSAQRMDMNEEFQALGKEIGRIASATKFNGISVFKGSSMSKVAFQVGWESGGANRIGSGELVVSGTASLSNFAASLTSRLDLKSITNASIAVAKLDQFLSTVQTTRAKWGAIMNRLDYTITNLQTVAANTKVSRSAIQDTNYAVEAANLARTQVLQQAGQAMLSQSNQNSQQILQLLQ
jgi:flagellin